MPADPRSPAEAAGFPAAGRRAGKLRRTLLIVGAAIAMLCLGGVGIAYVAYDSATQPDRSDPAVVVRQFLTATFDQRDDNRARLFTCAGTSRIAGIQDLFQQIRDREQRFDIRVTVSWEGFESQVNGSRGDVSAYLKVDVPEADGRPSRAVQRWRFNLRDQSGWRVCDAHRID